MLLNDSVDSKSNKEATLAVLQQHDYPMVAMSLVPDKRHIEEADNSSVNTPTKSSQVRHLG